MMPIWHLASLGREATLLSVAVALPVLVVAAIVGFVVAAFQAASQVQDPTLSHLPRMLAVAAALLILGPWMGSEIAHFAERVFLAAASTSLH